MTLLDRRAGSRLGERNKELLQRFDVIGPTLLDLAVTHEMGHGICQEKNERKADDYGRELREARIPDCKLMPGGKTTTVAQNSAIVATF